MPCEEALLLNPTSSKKLFSELLFKRVNREIKPHEIPFVDILSNVVGDTFYSRSTGTGIKESQLIWLPVIKV